jgi:hypothetical protein
MVTTIKETTGNEININKHNWSITTDAKGKLKFSLGNWTDAGWHWDGGEDQALGAFIRLANSKVSAEVTDALREDSITIARFKPMLIKCANKLDGLYELSGDNRFWHFGDDGDMSAMDLKEQLANMNIPKETRDKVEQEVYGVGVDTFDYKKFSAENGEWYRGEMTKIISSSKTFDSFFEQLCSQYIIMDIEELKMEFVMQQNRLAIQKAMKNLKIVEN